MPTVLRLPGLRVVIYPADHRPAHVHVISPDGEAVFILNCPEGPPELREVHGLILKETRHIRKGLEQHISALCEQWSTIHGNH